MRTPTLRIWNIYHFTSYEPSALKRLMGRHSTREDEIDRMLRAGLFIDLHTVLRRALRAGVEEYWLKALEVFHDFRRAVALGEARRAMRQMEHALELGHPNEADENVRKTIALYNADDCVSTRSLRDWLERERQALVLAGHCISRPTMSDSAPPESIGEHQLQTAALAEALKRGVSADPALRNEEDATRWLLANLLDWHRRESKADSWEYFRLKDLTDEDLLGERSALSGLRFVKRLGVQGKIPTDRYSFEKQETNIRAEDTVCERGKNVGEVVAIDIVERTIDIKKTKKTTGTHPKAIFVKPKRVNDDVLADVLFRLGTWTNSNDISAPGPYRAARDLLLRRAPRLEDRTDTLIHPNESTLDAAKRVGILLDSSVLPIQGPPGAGKTFTGARMICEVSDLLNRLRGAQVGTVDRFQGQQAPVVTYSLTTSSPEDAPRGMEFLYSLNRLNVATSRAQAVVIVVGSPRLLEPECHSPRQMQLANALCRYLEMAQVIETKVWVG